MRGNVILISADVPSSMEKILPQEQSLFPVNFKRKLSYEGHYLSEIIDKEKVVAYFQFLKKNNPHFQDMTLSTELIEEFCQKTRKFADDFMQHCQPTITDPEDEIEKEEIEEVPLSSQYPSVMMNKYQPNMDDETVSDKVADMIVQYEIIHNIEEEDDSNEFLSNDSDSSSSDSDEEIIPRKKTRYSKIHVAPGEGGKFQNWGEDIFLEEKCFPNLFPFGEGGYLSTCIKKKKSSGFAAYCRNRIKCIDPRFREDSVYIFFLLLIKEKVELKRAMGTYLRQARRTPNLNRRQIAEIRPENLERFNRTFNVFRNMRGTSSYYEAIKKDCMATLRQKGSPTLFLL